MKCSIRSLFWILSLLVVAASPACASAPTDRLDIVDRAIAHHGGGFYDSSEAELDVCSKSGCFHVLARRKLGHFYYAVSGTSRGARLEVVSTSETVTARRDGEELTLDTAGEQRYRDWAMARVYFSFLPYRLNDPGVYKQDLGVVDWDGRKLHKVKVTFEPGASTDAVDEYVYWFDPDSARLELFAYSYDDDGGGLRFRRATNHRRVGGVMFFDQENLGVDGPGLSVDQVDPAFVRDEMRHVSTVTLKDIRLRGLR
ncbi:MAG: hypothetical protein GY719_11635 [bacterium]|nr:hypothetical protein [bacterium]